MTRAEKSTRNAIAAVVSQCGFMILTFIIRMIMIKTIGIESVSLNGLFTEVIAMLSLVELGVGSAIVYNLYKPLAENDTKKLTQLMTLFKKAYRIIAITMFFIGLLLLPHIDLFVSKMNVSLNYLRLIYFLFLVKTSCSYLLAYKVSLINADQKSYIVAISNLIVKTIFTIIETVILLIFHNFVLYLILEIVVTLMSNIVLSLIADKKYSFLKNSDVLPKEESKHIFDNIKNIFLSSLCIKITSSTDNIRISTLVGTIQVGIYSQYAMIINGINTMVRQFNNGAAASIGDFMSTGNKEDCHNIMCNITFMNFMIGSIFGCCLITLLNPFISIVFGSQYVIDNLTLYVICYNFFLATICHCIWNFTNVSGLFAQDRNIAIIGTVFNLIISIIFGKMYGMVGIFFGTSLTHFIQGELKIRLLYNKNFKIEPKKFARKWWLYIILTAIEMYGCFYLYLKLPIHNLYLQFFIMMIIGICIPLLINLCLFYKTTEFQYLKNYGFKILNKFRRKICKN